MDRKSQLETVDHSNFIFRESEWNSIPEINIPLLIILKTDHFGVEEQTRLSSFLSEDEIIKNRRFRFLRERTSYTVIHGLLRWILGKHLGIEPRTIDFKFGTNRKPYITGYTRNIFFTLSHSSGVSLLAFDPRNEIGADVEMIDQEFDYEPIVKRWFTQEEVRYIGQSKEISRKRFYELWTRKEAYLKAIGEGITKNLSIEVLENKITNQSLVGNEGQHGDFILESMIYDRNYQITVALNENSSKLRIFAIP
ncbi:MAG: 4'-phosphopantetheinyl transferase superfamily protein [Bacteroidales bacterium]|jgi:4'-phosphopantetheinyl transferase